MSGRLTLEKNYPNSKHEKEGTVDREIDNRQRTWERAKELQDQ